MGFHGEFGRYLGHVDVDDGEEFDDEKQPTDCVFKSAFKDVMNAVTVLKD